MPQPNTNFNARELTQGIDVLEDSIRNLDRKLLDILLLDRTTRKNIIWATTEYQKLGTAFAEFSEIRPELVTGAYAQIVQPRITKSQNAQADRTRDKAEVFTPSWVCNKQNNLVDAQWFGRKDVFNKEDGTTWTVTETKVLFEEKKENWQKYVDALRLEISCGEAPYLASRYDTVTGEKIPLKQRIGLLDRKMRIVNENAENAEEWLTWSQRAFESVYGYEYQGDNLLLARENLFYSYIEYYYEKFGQMPEIALLRKIAHVVSWNIWQMDGLKHVVPGTCTPEKDYQMELDLGFPVDTESTCPGCARRDFNRHTGTICRIMDWRTKRSRTFISLIKGGDEYDKI